MLYMLTTPSTKTTKEIFRLYIANAYKRGRRELLMYVGGIGH